MQKDQNLDDEDRRGEKLRERGNQKYFGPEEELKEGTPLMEAAEILTKINDWNFYNLIGHKCDRYSKLDINLQKGKQSTYDPALIFV